MGKVANVLINMCCSSTVVCLIHRRIKARNSSGLFFRLLSLVSAVFQISDKHSDGGSAWWLKLYLKLSLEPRRISIPC